MIDRASDAYGHEPALQAIMRHGEDRASEAAQLFNDHFARANALLQECAPKPLVDDPKEAAAIADLVTRILFA